MHILNNLWAHDNIPLRRGTIAYIWDSNVHGATPCELGTVFFDAVDCETYAFIRNIATGVTTICKDSELYYDRYQLERERSIANGVRWLTSQEYETERVLPTPYTV